HDVDLLQDVVNKVWYLDANRATVDQYNLGWTAYLKQREDDEHRRRRERANAQRKASALSMQAAKLGAKATKAVAAKNMQRRADRLMSNLEEVRVDDKTAKVRLPQPAPCGKTPLQATGLSKSYGSLEIFCDVDVAVDKGSRVVILGLNGAGKTTLLRLLAGKLESDTGQIEAGYGLRVGYYAQEHETLEIDRTVLEAMRSAASNAQGDYTDTQLRTILGAFLFTGDDVDKPAGVLSGGEKTRLALATLVCSGANVLLLDEPTNNLDPASREQVLDAISRFPGAIVLVTHDPGAVEALRPERAILLPDGDEDIWSDDMLELVELA
ncbi:MAG TPA: ATP-binding cassette domain-containing protein, partial [Candidatus Stackebrandtia faecavium]|nr:ATP-binding cassette domain-containing protein [Candidatus Stackebrandtia faecavium]